MEIKCEDGGKNLIVFITGDIDHHSAQEIKRKVDKSFERSNAKNIIISFKNVSFMDSSGIGMLMGRYKTINYRGGGKLVAAEMTAGISRIFDMSGLSKIISRAATVEEAVRSL
ncbi:MAG: anti-sigma factor antagonist [Clostridiales bacterium]|jgi:stage II sporulation protein AA (anti-sigma F factor antagonist)|nr:anti-sigma factor antagonist [Clostridiales bacterium]